MFKGLSVFFETYSITATDAKKEVLHPIDVSCGIEQASQKTKELLNRLGYSDVIDDTDFKELFAKNENFEVTVSFIGLPNGGTRIGVAVYSPKGKLTKKVLIGFMEKISQTFIDEKI